MFLLFQTEFIKISNQLVISCVNFRRIVNCYCCFLSILINNDEWSNNRIPINHIEKQWISWTTGGSLETLSFSAVLLEPYRVTMCSSLKTRFEMTDKERFFCSRVWFYVVLIFHFPHWYTGIYHEWSGNERQLWVISIYHLNTCIRRNSSQLIIYHLVYYCWWEIQLYWCFCFHNWWSFYVFSLP